MSQCLRLASSRIGRAFAQTLHSPLCERFRSNSHVFWCLSTSCPRAKDSLQWGQYHSGFKLVSLVVALVALDVVRRIFLLLTTWARTSPSEVGEAEKAEVEIGEATSTDIGPDCRISLPGPVWLPIVPAGQNVTCEHRNQPTGDENKPPLPSTATSGRSWDSRVGIAVLLRDCMELSSWHSTQLRDPPHEATRCLDGG